ncbi:MAG TPA: squalene--hopene cyclase [Candidatus Baltobacteraceae bacterium]|nr:squalene--hopene cyclase [Candidatus Baltobacteraceae bacterium]
MTAVAQGTSLAQRVEAAVAKSRDRLLRQQFPEGYWWAKLQSNVSITAEVVLLHKIWDTEARIPLERVRTYLLREQRAHGGWELFYDDGGELSTSVEAYMALRLLGVPADDPALVRAREFILARGGISKTRIFTKLHLALIGCYEWRGLPILPPWIMLLPKWSPFTIYDMSSWARGSTVPLVIVFDGRPVFEVTPKISLDELYAEGRAKATFRLPVGTHALDEVFLTLDRGLRRLQDARIVPFRRRALSVAREWILERQETTGDWAGIIPAMLNSLLALRVSGYDKNDPAVVRGMDSVDRFGVDDGECYWVQPSISVVWDTALVIRALADAGVAPDHPALVHAAEWLLSKQILKGGDWQGRSRGEPGGWAFEFWNDYYPDVDDSAAVIMALHDVRMPDEPRKRGAVLRGARWIDSMVSRDGGWGAYDVDNDKAWLNRLPYADLRAMIDPNTADLTAHVIEMHLHCETIGDRRTMERAIRFLLDEQEADGSWFGRWGVNYLNGTGSALVALALLPAKPEYAAALERGIRWLLSVQNADGGWGETARSYDDPDQKAIGPSTPSQTAWALQGLIACYERLDARARRALELGVAFLLERQLPDGSWDEPEFTGTGFPGHFYLNYNLYREHYPLSALGRYLRLGDG